MVAGVGTVVGGRGVVSLLTFNSVVDAVDGVRGTFFSSLPPAKVKEKRRKKKSLKRRNETSADESE